MKRKAATNNSNRQLAASFTLIHFADEILDHICSYLSFKDRHVSRRVCNRFLEFVDKSTPGSETLHVSFTEHNHWVPFNEEFPKVSMKPFGASQEQVQVSIEVLSENHSGGGRRSNSRALRNELAALLQSRLPRREALDWAVDR